MSAIAGCNRKLDAKPGHRLVALRTTMPEASLLPGAIPHHQNKITDQEQQHANAEGGRDPAIFLLMALDVV